MSTPKKVTEKKAEENKKEEKTTLPAKQAQVAARIAANAAKRTK